MRNLIGQQIGPYKIEELIGAGGMADVYRAHQANLDRYVAIKVLKASLADDPEFVARFSREAMASGGLRHPNILRIYDAGTYEDRHYIVMDFANGGTLAQLAEKRQLTIDEITAIGIQIADALDYAYKRSNSIVHRDLKPSNILLDDDRPLLADFGIAHMMTTEKRLTQTGASLGTPEYMSPEQSEGFPVDGRTDIYSLGVILFQLVTGRVPFQGKTPIATMHDVVYSPTPQLRQFKDDVPDWMESIILRALAKRPADRFATAGAMAEALRKRQLLPLPEPAAGVDDLAGRTIAAPRVRRTDATPVHVKVEREEPAEPAAGRGKGRPLIFGLVAAAVLVLVGAGAILALPALRGNADGRQQGAQSAATATAQAVAALSVAGPATDAKTGGAGGLAAAAAVTATATPSLPPPSPTAAAVQAAPSATATVAPTTPPTSAPTEAPTATVPAPTNTVAPSATSPAPTNTPAATRTPAPPTNTPVRATSAPATASQPQAPGTPGTVLDFEYFTPWRRGDQPYGTLTQSSEQAHGGQSSAKLAYDFPAVDNEYVVFQNQAGTTLPGQPTVVTLWVYGDGSGHFLNLWLRDAAGQVRAFTFGRITHKGWLQLTAPIDTAAPWPQDHISGPDSSKLVYPLSVVALVFDAAPHNAGPFNGAIYLDDLAAASSAPAPSAVGTPTAQAGNP